MFRKFFYENSAPIEDLVSFVEISNILLARKIGITNTDQVVIVQNTNRYHNLPQEFKLLNLELERTDIFKDILDATLKERFG